MKVYIVSSGSYSDYSVVGVYKTKERAELAKLLYNTDNDLEEFEFDYIPKHPKGKLFYCVRMDINGNSNQKNPEYLTFKESVDSYVWRKEENKLIENYGNKIHISFYVWAKNEKHATKIANEKRIRLIANNEWHKILKV